MEIQTYTVDRAQEIADVFHQAVHAIDVSVYTATQKEAWAPTPPDYGHWVTRLRQKRPFLALVNDRVAGFMELDPDGHIDCMYTHPDFQRQGIASALYERVHAEALARKMPRLFVEASWVARPFFARRGFVVLSQNEVKRRGFTLINFSMEKSLRVF